MNWEEESTLHDMIQSVSTIAKTVWYCSRESHSDQMDMKNLSDHMAPTASLLPFLFWCSLGLNSRPCAMSLDLFAAGIFQIGSHIFFLVWPWTILELCDHTAYAFSIAGTPDTNYHTWIVCSDGVFPGLALNYKPLDFLFPE
jgi:hypothetical protein